MTFVQYPFEVLSALGSNLNDVSARLADKQRGAADCAGLGGDGQSQIADAIGDFRHTWKASVESLVADIDRWGGLSKAIGDMVAQFDTQMATVLRPSGNPTPATP